MTYGYKKIINGAENKGKKPLKLLEIVISSDGTVVGIRTNEERLLRVSMIEKIVITDRRQAWKD